MSPRNRPCLFNPPAETGLSMDTFTYRDGELYAENVPLSAIAERYGTPVYVYSRAYLE